MSRYNFFYWVFIQISKKKISISFWVRLNFYQCRVARYHIFNLSWYGFYLTCYFIEEIQSVLVIYNNS